MCAALAVAAADRGRRVLVCEVGAQQRIPRLLGRPGGNGHEVELETGLSALSVDPTVAMREWLSDQLPGPLSRVLRDSQTFAYFYAAAPGARELVTMVKVWELTQTRRWEKKAPQYDLVIVDAPATGHALGMLRTPRTFGDIARVGPIRGQADRVWGLLTDPEDSGYAAVTTLGDMPVNETIFLEDKLRDQIGRPLELVLANGVYPRRFSAEELERIASVDGDGLPRAAALAASSQATRVKTQQAQLRRLRAGTKAKVATVPYVFKPELELADIEDLARRLAPAL